MSNCFSVMGHGEQVRGVALASLSVILFSSFTLASRLGFSSSFAWPDLAALRFGIGGLLLLPILLRARPLTVSWPAIAPLAFLGGVGFAGFAYAGFSLAPAAHGAVLLHGTLPLSTAAVLGLTGKHLHMPYRSLGLALIGAGVVLMASDSLSGTRPSQALGDFFLLAASACWSGYGLAARRLNLPAAQAASLVAVLSMCCYLPIYLLLRGGALLAVPVDRLAAQALMQGVLIGAVSIFVYTRAIGLLGPATMALFTAAVPCITTFAAIPLLHETPSPLSLAGVGAVTLGVLAANRSHPEKRERQ